MNRFLEIQTEKGNRPATHYNLTDPRVRQGETRAKKTYGGYRPSGVRAKHDIP